MLFQTTSAHEELRAKIRSFAEEEIKPLAFLMDQNNEFPEEAVKKLGKLGWMGIPYPKEYGGAGLDALSYAIAVEELARVDGGTGVILSAHVSLGSWPIFAYGTEEQKKKYLVPLAKGEKIGAFGLTETNAGSDAGGTETTALDKGDYYLLNGGKIFITNAPKADTYVVFAVTTPDIGTRGISAFIVEKGWKGFEFGDHYDKMGIRSSSTAELIFNNVKVPKENLLGKEGEGFKIAMSTLDGGRINLHGDLPLLASNQYATAAKRSPNIVGSGLFMESIEQNPVYYDLAFEMPLHRDSIDVEKWLADYARRRYGAVSQNAETAWTVYLLRSAYTRGTNGTEFSSIIAARPALDVKKSGPNAGFAIPYHPTDLIQAEALLLQDADKLGDSRPYRFDIIDIQRQIMSNLGQAIHKQAAKAFKEKDKTAFRLHSQRFLELLKDVDTLLRTRPEFNFDRWLTQARRWGTTLEEQDLYEKDATALFTIWGADKDPFIFDYGWKEWAGLIDGYYLKRWEKFYAMLEEHLDKGTEYSEQGLPLTHNREAFRANDFYSSLGDWELQYVSTPGKARTPITQGDEIETAQRMYRKYAALADEYYREGVQRDEVKEENRFENLGKK